MVSRRAGVLAGLALVLGLVNAMVFQRETLLHDGRPVYLALAPADPRSILSGDYMRLDYEVSQEATRQSGDWPSSGRLVVRLDERGVGTFVRRDDGSRLEPGEVRLRYRSRRGRVGLGADAWFFEEGTAKLYQEAKYGELRVAPDGTVLIAGLRDKGLEPLK